MREVPCNGCRGSRLRPEVLAVTVAGYNIAEVCALSVAGCAELLAGLELTDSQMIIAERVVKEINARLRFLLDVGLTICRWIALRRACPVARHSGSGWRLR